MHILQVQYYQCNGHFGLWRAFEHESLEKEISKSHIFTVGIQMKKFENFKKPTYLNIRACFQLLILINKHLVNYIIKKIVTMVFSNFIQIISITPFAKKCFKKKSCLNKQCKNTKH